MTRIDFSTPFDALNKSSGFLFRAHQFLYKLRIGLIGFDGVVQPIGDVKPSTCDVSCTSIIIAQCIIPETQPMGSEVILALKQLPYQPIPLICFFIHQKGFHLFWCWQESDQIEINPSDKSPVICWIGPGQFLCLEITVCPFVNGIAICRSIRWQGRISWRQRCIPECFFDLLAVWPGGTCIDPCSNHLDFLFSEFFPLGRHDVFMAFWKADPLVNLTRIGIARNNNSSTLSTFHEQVYMIQAQVSFYFFRTMAVIAIVCQDCSYLKLQR